MTRIGKMVSTLSAQVERLGVEVVCSEVGDDRHAVIVTDKPPRNAAVLLSRELPGCVFIGGSHISWGCSNFAVALHTADSWERLAPVREATSAIVGASARYGIGACARQVVAWLGPAEPTNSGLRAIIGDWHYQRCSPCCLDSAYQFDLSACYYNLLTRLPGLRPSFCAGELFWRCTPCEELERFRVMLAAVGPVKALRNALVGAFYGSASGVYLRSGKPQRFRTAPGARQSLATVIVRTAYELCYLQAEVSGAVYANADSVISADADASFWRSVGLPFTLVASGDAQVQAIGKYRVGPKATKSYEPDQAGSMRVRTDRPPVEALYWPWLTAP